MLSTPSLSNLGEIHISRPTPQFSPSVPLISLGATLMECRQNVFSTENFFALRALQSLDTQKICEYLRTNFKAEDLEKANIIYARGKMSNFEFRVLKSKEI